MQRHDPVRLGQSEPLALAIRIEVRPLREQRIDHRVADEPDPVRRDASRPKQVLRLRARREVQIGQEVTDDAVDLLGHRAVERAQPGLDVGARHAELGRHEARRERAVDVAVEDSERRRVGRPFALQADHGRRGLLAVRPRADGEVHVRRRDLEIAEEHIGHQLVVVLAGVDDPLGYAALAQGPDDRCRLDEIRASADDVGEVSGHRAKYERRVRHLSFAGMPDLRQTIRRLLRGAASDESEPGRSGGPSGPGGSGESGAPRPKRRYLADATEGIARVRAAGHDRPMVVATWPLDAQNPFQALLTGRFEEAGLVPVGMDRLADLDDPVALPALVALKSDDVDVVLHLHWLARVLRGATTEDDGRRRVKAFLGSLDVFRAAGGRIVWTAHNVLPHDTPFPDVDVELRRGVVARADVVHVLSEGTVAAAAPLYEIPPDKVLHLPHPAYLGVYPDDVSDADARRHYGLGADDIVFGLVGHLRPYKGLDALLDAFESLAAAPPDTRRRRLLITGTPSADPSIDVLLARARAHPDVVVDARRIPADELSVPLRASDVIVLPYRSSLNSGALLLALSFGRPVIAAASPHVSETVGRDAAITFEPDDRDALGAALRSVDALLTPAAREAALETARRFDPDELSRRLAAALRERLDRGAMSVT